MLDGVILLTGANGHLGRTLAMQLKEQGARVRGLVLPGEAAPELEALDVEIVRGDMRDKDSLRPLFAGAGEQQTTLIHAAAIIDITSEISPLVYDVNVGGVKNIVSLALEHEVRRFIHISSVHAIPEARDGREMREIKDFSPERVHGGYAKTKAEGTQFVMESIAKHGLPAIVLHPSGIVGPGDRGSNNIISAIRWYMSGRLPAIPNGGYNLVDVRDVAATVIAAIEKGQTGEPYILSGTHYKMADIFAMVRTITGHGKKLPVVPIWLVGLAAPLMERWAKMKKEKPVMTRYAIHALESNDNFNHEKASRALGFWPRDFYETLRDTLADMEGGMR